MRTTIKAMWEWWRRDCVPVSMIAAMGVLSWGAFQVYEIKSTFGRPLGLDGFFCDPETEITGIGWWACAPTITEQMAAIGQELDSIGAALHSIDVEALTLQCSEGL